MNTRSSPNPRLAPRGARRRAPRRARPADSTTRIPRPPPPAAALTSSGYCASAAARLGLGVARHDRHAGLPRGLLGAELVAHQLDRLRPAARRTRPRPPRTRARAPGSRTGSRSRGAAPRAPAARARGDDRLDLEVGGRSGTASSASRTCGACRVGRRVDGDRLDPEPVQRADHAARDLAAVGDQDAVEHQRCQSTGPATSVWLPSGRPRWRCSSAGAREQRRQVDAGLDPHLVQHRDEVLGGDVAGRARRHRAAAELAEARLERATPASSAA